MARGDIDYAEITSKTGVPVDMVRDCVEGFYATIKKIVEETDYSVVTPENINGMKLGFVIPGLGRYEPHMKRIFNRIKTHNYGKPKRKKRGDCPQEDAPAVHGSAVDNGND